MTARTLRVAVASVAAVVATAAGAFTAQSASAHGAVSYPVTRAYDCNQRWQSPSDPGMQSKDPMCYQAYQANPQALYNWNGLFREGLKGQHQANIPDGTLCSGGLAKDGMYAAMDVPGNWNTTSLPNQFTLKLNDPSSHGADYLQIYVTKQGFDPLTQKLKWSDLELVTTTGRQAPTTTYTADVNAGSRTGRHIVYTVWQASHLDQSYYACSDVVFGGGTNPSSSSPNPGPSSSSPNPGPSSSSPNPGPSSSSPNPGPSSSSPNPTTGACSATVKVSSQWSGGYQADVTVKAGTSSIRGWKVSFAGTVSQGWNATFSTSGSSTVATNVSYNGAIAANGTATFGFLGTGTPATTATCSPV
jgi:predicted carbohydrate-binding protein with CBM5 and CBM33 domain